MCHVSGVGIGSRSRLGTLVCVVDAGQDEVQDDAKLVMRCVSAAVHRGALCPVTTRVLSSSRVHVVMMLDGPTLVTLVQVGLECGVSRDARPLASVAEIHATLFR